MTAQCLTNSYKALVIGASGAIGNSFCLAFEQDLFCSQVDRVSRSSHEGFDLENEGGIAATAASFAGADPYDIIVDATGALTIDGVGPEKSLAALSQGALMRTLQINAIGPALLLKHFSPLLAKGPSVYAKLSARVGSISDNQKGGWYGYRSAKAALNMMLQTAAIELQRKNPALRVVALQPGTVESSLSRPFVSSASAMLTPQESVDGMLAAIKALPAQPGAQFVDYKGQTIGW